MSRTKRKTKSYSLLIIPDSKESTRSFKISAVAIKIATVFFIGLIVLIAFGFSTYWRVAEVAIDYSRLKEENFKLKKSLQRVDKMQEKLSKMQAIDKKIRNSLTGYIKIAHQAGSDSNLTQLDFNAMQPDVQRVLFNSIPSLLPVKGFITRGFDVRNLQLDPHLGLDIAASKGTPVVAPADGVVVFSGWTAKSGHLLIIKHGYNYLTLYKHNQRNLVSVMEKVSKGQVIALLGDTGKISSGAHLHFEIWKGRMPVNPLLYVGGQNLKK